MLRTLLLILFALFGLIGWSAWKSSIPARVAVACVDHGGGGRPLMQGNDGTLLIQCNDNEFVAR